MNLVLLEPTDIVSPGHALVGGRRAEHIREVHQPELGGQLRVGMLGGLLGTARVVGLGGVRLDPATMDPASASGDAATAEAIPPSPASAQGSATDLRHNEASPSSPATLDDRPPLEPDLVELAFTLDQAPPPPLAITLVLALPRPRVLKRALQSIAAQGVKRVVLVNSWRVDKSYWKSPAMAPASLREQLLLGLEQARDTVLPDVTLEPLFKPFAEDRLPVIAEGTRALVAHPTATTPLAEVLARSSGDDHGRDCDGSRNGSDQAPEEPRRTTLCVGPEGGWIEYEVEKLTEAGCTPIALGPRVLRVEDALTSLLAKLG